MSQNKENRNKILTKNDARALYLAQRGLGSVSTNPMVGSVITHNDKIIGEDFIRIQ